MSQEFRCLTLDQFYDVSLGASEIDEDVLGLHLESCEACQMTLENLSDHRSLSFLKDSTSYSVPRSPELSLVMHGLSAMSSSGAGNHAMAADSRLPVDLSPWLTPVDSAAKNGIGKLGDFELLRALGQGGMGVVYLANEPELDRPVALKILLPELAKLPSARERFLTEARASAALKHPNVVAIHRVASSGELPFLVLEYVDGATLDESISDLNETQKLQIAKDIVAAVSAAHELKIVHRDIKPSNIMIERKSKAAKLTDFGLAKMEAPSQRTQSGIVVGTPGYIAPEVLSGQSRPNELSDIHNLGVTLRRIFPAPDDSPDWMESVIESATQHNPAKRP